MGYSEAYQANPWQNPQGWGQANPLHALLQNVLGQGGGQGIGQAAFGQGGYGSPFGQAAWGGQGQWGQSGWGQGPWGGAGWGQRQLSHHDIGEVVRQLLPLLPHVVAQAQQPQAAFGYGGFGQGGFGQGGFGYGPFGQGQRQLSQQDIGEVVRHILPILPQVVSALQGQQGPYAAAVYGNYGWPGQGHSPFGQYGLGQGGGQGGWGFGQQGGQFGPLQAAFGRGQGYGPQFNQADIGEVVRQLTAVIPQVIANLQQAQQQQQRGGV